MPQDSFSRKYSHLLEGWNLRVCMTLAIVFAIGSLAWLAIVMLRPEPIQVKKTQRPLTTEEKRDVLEQLANQQKDGSAVLTEDQKEDVLEGLSARNAEAANAPSTVNSHSQSSTGLSKDDKVRLLEQLKKSNNQ